MRPSIQEMSIFVYRHMPDGQSSIAPCKIAILNSEDAEESIRLNNVVSPGLSCDIFAASSEEEVLRFLGDEGTAIGVRFENRLISVRAFSVSKMSLHADTLLLE